MEELIEAADTDTKKKSSPTFSNIWKGLTGKKTEPAKATDAYLKTKYKVVKNDEERLNDFKVSLNSLIEGKSECGNYCCVIEMPDDIKKYIGDVMTEYKEHGYSVANLKDSVKDVKTDVIFVSWFDKY